MAGAAVDIEIVGDKRSDHHLDGQIGQTQYTQLHTLVQASHNRPYNTYVYKHTSYQQQT
jgi:hypothetical protein